MIHYSSLYDRYFPLSKEVKWEDFRSQEADLIGPLSSRMADFSVEDRTWGNLAKSVTLIFFKTVLFSLALHLVARHTLSSFFNIPSQSLLGKVMEIDLIAQGLSACPLPYKKLLFIHKSMLILWAAHSVIRYTSQRVIMLFLYPAQSRLIKKIFPIFGRHSLDVCRQKITKDLREKGYIVRHVTLKKNGIVYSGILVCHESTLENGQWVLQATGNGEPVEHSIVDFAKTYHGFKLNTLVVNGPSVGRSQGQATPKTMGDAQRMGLLFLETALKAKYIVIAGRSLGGAAIGEAILQHSFKKEIRYLVVRQMTFDRVSNVSAKLIGSIFSKRLEGVIKKIIQWSGCEMDSIRVSKRLSSLGIKEVIVQASNKKIQRGKVPTTEDFYTDGPIHERASLARALIEEGVLENKAFICLARAPHMTPLAISACETEIDLFRN